MCFNQTEGVWTVQVMELNRLGRLLSYDPRTGNVTVLLDSLYMPNGIALSPDETFLLLAETSIARIHRYRHPSSEDAGHVCETPQPQGQDFRSHTGSTSPTVWSTIRSSFRYWLKGLKAGTKEVVLDNMIGYPDNIRLSDHRTFLVGIATPRFQKSLPPFLDLTAPYPAVKRFLVKVGVQTSLVRLKRQSVRTLKKKQS